MNINLTKEQKESVGLLSIGTFLEYFDLMLYIHMAVLLNELFFPKSDPSMASILSGFAFCSTFVFRPFGALIFGWIGDNIGRKATIIITNFMMAISCIVMAITPTYYEIGITATYIVTICRIIQGMASMGEAISAELYLTETIKPPFQYPAVALISVFIALGMMSALGIASLITSIGFNWRYAFWIGAAVAILGVRARTRLRETKDFIDARFRYERILEKMRDYKKNRNIIFLIKIFDRLHNIQTISFKSIEKQKKIAIETLTHILPLAIYLGIYKVEKLLSNICSQILSKPYIQFNDSELEVKKKL